jgi:hypothetical protein
MPEERMRDTLFLAALLSIILAGCGDRKESAEPPPADRPQAGAPRSDAAGDAAGGVPQVAERGTVPIEIVAMVGGKEITVRGVGECEHSADASIYERPAKVWTARYSGSEPDPVQYSNLAVWQESAGPVGFNLSVMIGKDRHDIATVKGGEIKGSGTASLAEVGSGRLSVEGKTENGTPLRLKVQCGRFLELIAEGG